MKSIFELIKDFYKSVLGMNILFITLLFGFGCFGSNNDSDLQQPDGYGGAKLTNLGCLVNGPWNVSRMPGLNGFNLKLFLNDSEVLSKGVPYTETQKDLVFELHKNGKITYWLRSENDQVIDTMTTDQIRVITKQSFNEKNFKKIYTSGHWKVNFKDSLIFIYFDNNRIPDLNYKWSYLGNGRASFQEIFVFDSIVGGKKIAAKKVNTISYETLYPRF